MEYLYHYTNTETLALILKNRTIRFNSLDKVDDLQENMTADLTNAGKFVFISCWTDNEKESIPMWNMYASLEHGVRIRLRKAPFKIYTNPADEISAVSKLCIVDNTNGKPLKSVIPIAEMLSKGYVATEGMNRNPDCLLHKIEYTNDQKKLYPQLVSEEGEKFCVALNMLGIYKNTLWAFQNEWRYILHIIPLNINQSPDQIKKEFLEFSNKLRTDSAPQPFRFYDMIISDEAFADMQITLSPKISPKNRTIVESLVKEFNPTAKLFESVIAGLI